MKAVIKKLLNNKTLPVLSSSLRGTRLRMNELVNGSVFIRDFEPDKQHAFRFLLGKKNVLFDVGANVGLHSYYVTRKFPDVKIIAFEPLPGNVAYIRETIAVNKFQNISVVEAAVSSSEGEAFFDDSGHHSMGMLVDHVTRLKVKLITLNDYARNNNIYPDVLKIDVEGAEGEVLKGADQLIRHSKPSFIIELHNPTQDLEVARILLGHGYTIYRLNEHAAKTPENILLPISKPNVPWPDPDGVWGNLIAIHSTKLGEFGL